MILASENMSNTCVQRVGFGLFKDNDSTAWTDGDGKMSDKQQYGHDFYCPGIGI